MILAFDIGGTAIKYGLIHTNGKLTKRFEVPTPNEEGGLQIIKQVIQIIKDVKKDVDIKGIAISSAGVIDPYQGVVLATTKTMKDYVGLRIKDMIEIETHLFTTVENDVNCAALAETVYGEDRPQDFIAMTIGTGIGGAIVHDGKIVHGSSYSAGEWGRLLIDGVPYETEASTAAIVKLAQSKGLDVTSGKSLFKRYDEDHDVAVEVVNIFYRKLAAGIINLVYALNPSQIIIGGGISDRGERFIDELKQALSEKLEPYFMQSFELRLATLKNDSGMLGAYVHHLQQLQTLK